MAPLPRPAGGGLIILPKKSWNVWNNDNLEKVRKDEQKNARQIEATQNRRREIEQTIRFERLKGAEISEADAEKRIEDGLKDFNADDYIAKQSLESVASEHNRRQTNAALEKTIAFPTKRKLEELRKSNIIDRDALPPHKKHRKNTTNDNYSSMDRNGNFTLFDAKTMANPGRKAIEIEKAKREEKKSALGNLSIEMTKHKDKPWYLVSHDKEHDRRKMMQPDAMQRGLPYHLRDSNRDTTYLQRRNDSKKSNIDPLAKMNAHLHKNKHNQMRHNMNTQSTTPTMTPTMAASSSQSTDNHSMKSSSSTVTTTGFDSLMGKMQQLSDKNDRKKQKKLLKKQAKQLKKSESKKSKKKKQKYESESDSDSDDNYKKRRRQKKDKKKKRKESSSKSRKQKDL